MKLPLRISLATKAILAVLCLAWVPFGALGSTTTESIVEMADTCTIAQAATNVSTTLAPGDVDFVIGQSFTACATGQVLSLAVTATSSTMGDLTISFATGPLATNPEYTQEVAITGAGELVFELTTPFPVEQDSIYSFSLSFAETLPASSYIFNATTTNPYPDGEYFEGVNAASLASNAGADFVFELDIAEAPAACTIEQTTGTVGSLLNTAEPDFVIGQSFTACATGEVTSLALTTTSTTMGDLTIHFSAGPLTTTPEYTQVVAVTGAGEQVFTLDVPFAVEQDSTYSFSLTMPGANYSLEVASGNPYPDGAYFEGLNAANLSALSDVDFTFRLNIGEDETAVGTRNPLAESVGGLSAFPNPTHGEFTVAYELSQASEVAVMLYDQQGRVLRRLVQGRQTVGAHQVTLAADGLPQGVIYYGLLTDQGHSRVERIIIQ